METNDYQVYKSLVVQTRVRSFPNRTDGARPHATWKWEYMLMKMCTPGERIAEEEEGSEDTDDIGTTSSVGDTGESSNISLSEKLSSPHTRSRSLPPSSTHTRFHSLPPSPARTRSHGKAKKTKDREHPYKGDGVVYLPGDIIRLTRKLHLLDAEFFSGNTTVRNELVHVLDALLRLKQLTRKEYTDITARLAA